ncbi:hypothetical protein P691DRAFT_804114 [Macrolepiota fuliginosa MF-IS2]|uniref:DUF6534 domain-containing protein n=1 Tax=Macrolepiota fuliginosa MF-IS2 TaxID=1400762 RepID=A0A9P5XNH9_9AGAR|nr:hypothetical protein P691DRAFT_804114 [Macrolepiota fuliginosa MF-IS2]
MALDTTYGSAFIGLIVAAVLYGVTLLQTFFYYKTYPKDPKVIKALVAIVWFLDTSHLVLCTIAIYWYLVMNFSDPDALTKTTWSMNLQTDCNGLIGLIVECFFARRVWIMSGNGILTLIIVVLACVHFGLGVVFTVEEFLLVENTRFSKLIWVTSTGLGSAAAADIIIACALCYYLLKSRTGFTNTDSLIATLIGYSLTTGLITSVLAFICVVTFATMPTNYIWLAFFWVLGKCYVNSLLAALNSRDSLRERVKPREGTFLHLSHLPQFTTEHQPESPRSDDKSSRHLSRQGVPGSLAVNVHTQTYCRSDYDRGEDSPATPTTGKSTSRFL